jgi:outer membrane protein assembly factor BamB
MNDLLTPFAGFALPDCNLAVIPVLVGPLQVLLALLPALLSGLVALLFALFRPGAVKMALVVLWRQKVVIAVIVCVIALGGYLLSLRGTTGARGGGTKAGQGWFEWPMLRGDAMRRGTVPGSLDAVRSGVNWSFSMEAKTFYSSPALAEGRVYATSAEKGVFKDEGSIYCLDAATGGVIWRSAPKGYRASISSPAISGRYLVCGEGLHDTEDGRVVCLDIERDGAILWEYRTRSHVESSPCISEGRVYIGAGDDGYYCLSLEPDAQGKAQVLWHTDPAKFPDAETSPLVYDRKVYIGLGVDGQAICCLDAETGRELWRVSTPCPVFAAPTLAKGKLFVGMGIGNFVESEEEVRIAQSKKAKGQTADLPLEGQMWCLNAATGAVEWRFTTSRTVLQSVAATEDCIYLFSRDGFMYKVGYDGREIAKWRAPGGANILTAPALGASHLYAATAQGRLYCLSADKLQPVWDAPLGKEGLFASSPALMNGRIFVGTGMDGLVCIGSSTAKKTDETWEGFMGGPGRSGAAESQVIPATGTMRWTYPSAGDDRITVVAPIAVAGDRICVGVADGRRKGIACLNTMSDGRDAPSELWFHETPGPVALSPAASAERLLFVQGAPGESSRSLRCVKSTDGTLLWETPIARTASADLLLTGDLAIIQDDVATLTCFGLSGTRVWRTVTGALSGPPAVRGDILVVASSSPPSVMALDRLTGLTLWQKSMASTLQTGPVTYRASIYVGTSEGVTKCNLLDGSTSWVCRTGPVAKALTMRDDLLACVTTAGEAMLVGTDGSIVARLSGALPEVPPIFCGNLLLYAGRSDIVAYDIAAKQTHRWLRSVRHGAITSPMVAANHCLYFGTAGSGLLCAGEGGKQP